MGDVEGREERKEAAAGEDDAGTEAVGLVEGDGAPGKGRTNTFDFFCKSENSGYQSINVYCHPTNTLFIRISASTFRIRSSNVIACFPALSWLLMFLIFAYFDREGRLRERRRAQELDKKENRDCHNSRCRN